MYYPTLCNVISMVLPRLDITIAQYYPYYFKGNFTFHIQING